ncbi:MAG: gluconeogenesis factor YvcK family protein [archaeon]
MKKVVVIGGGTGSFNVLKGLKGYDVDVAAVVNMTDDGGSTGILRDEFGILPPGDVRRCLVALSDSTESMKQLFQYRFTDNSSLKGHSLGNLLLAALKDINGSDEKAIKEACRLLNIKGKVLPVTLKDCRLNAELEDGTIIRGEKNLDNPQHDGTLKIRRLFLSESAPAYEDALHAIGAADMIVLGPGDLYGSVIANLVVDGISEAIRNSKAKKVYVCNLMTKHGETNGFKVSDFVKEIENYLHTELDYVIVNSSKFSPFVLDKYSKEKASPVEFDELRCKNFKAGFIVTELMTSTEVLRHDSTLLAEKIINLF